jgi:uncharacterized protein DUF4126
VDSLTTVSRTLGFSFAAGVNPYATVAILGLASRYLAKTSTRFAANTSPEPFSNWILSLPEDGFVVILGLLALKCPLAAVAIAIGGAAVSVMSARWLVRRARHRMRRA